MNLLALLPSVHLPMLPAVVQATQVLLALFAVSGAFLLGCQIVMLLAWRKRTAPPVSNSRPAVSILRPLAGFDDDTELLLEVAVAALGPADELVLGVASERDAAYPIAQRVQALQPDRVRLVLTNPAAAINPKVAQLIGMTAVAKGEIFVVSATSSQFETVSDGPVRRRTSSTLLHTGGRQDCQEEVKRGQHLIS